MSYKRLVLFLTFLAIFTMSLRISVDSDTWWHLRAGTEIVEKRAILTEDPFSLTRFMEPWRYPGWLAQIILYGAYEVFGFAGLNLFTALMVTIAFAWVWRYVEGPYLFRSSLILLAAVTSGVYWSARPQIITFALSGATIFLLERDHHRESKRYWAYLLVMALWGNIHGGFAIGFLLIAAYAGGDVLDLLRRRVFDPSQLAFRDEFSTILKSYGTIFGLAMIGLSLNPHGPLMILYPFKTVSIGVLREYIQEWQSPDFHNLAVLPFMVMIGVAFLAFGVKRKNSHPTDYLLILGFLFMSFWAARNIATFALTTVIPISRGLSDLGWEFPGKKGSRPLSPKIQSTINTILVILLVIAALLKVSVPLDNAYNQETLAETYPSGAVEFLASEVTPAPLFNSYNWGAYILWELYPDYTSFVDGRTDLFDDEILEAYLSAWRGEEAWIDLFEQWDIQIALIEPGAPLVAELRSAGWAEVYTDKSSVIFLPSDGR